MTISRAAQNSLKTHGGYQCKAPKVPYRFVCTATPSPNDHTELGNHAEFLGVMRQQEMLSKWFINDTATASQDWRLKGHAVEDFWGFVASWSRCATLPSDLSRLACDLRSCLAAL